MPATGKYKNYFFSVFAFLARKLLFYINRMLGAQSTVTKRIAPAQNINPNNRSQGIVGGPAFLARKLPLYIDRTAGAQSTVAKLIAPAQNLNPNNRSQIIVSDSPKNSAP
jgi:hypothetical protein